MDCLHSDLGERLFQHLLTKVLVEVSRDKDNEDNQATAHQESRF